MADENPIYRERAHLIAHLATIYQATIVLSADRENPMWPVIFVDTPKGQLSWHLSGDDMDLFKHVRITTPEHGPNWDGHTTEQKYERLDALTKARNAELTDRAQAWIEGDDATRGHTLDSWMDRPHEGDLAPGEPAEIADLPVEVRALIHAVDSMRSHWAEAALPGSQLSDRQQELWRNVHTACSAVWGRLDE